MIYLAISTQYTHECDRRTDGRIHDGYQRAPLTVHMASRGKSFRRISLKLFRGVGCVPGSKLDPDHNADTGILDGISTIAG